MRTAPLARVLVGALAGAATAEAQDARPPGEPASPPPVVTAAQDFELRTRTFTLPKGWSMRFDVPAGCPTCGPSSTGSIPNGNAPWRAFGGLQWQGPSTTLGATLVAERGTRLPLYMSAPANSVHVPTASESRPSDMRLRWQTVLSLEQIVARTRSGNTASVFGEAFLPFGGRTAVKGGQDTGAVSSSALISGIRLRF
jgi:hypothetical protein